MRAAVRVLMETRTTRLLSVVLAVLAVLVASSADAQSRGRDRVDAHIVATPGRLVSARDAHLLDETELALEAPSAGDYVLPVGGVILGGVALVGGGIPLVIGLLVMPFAVDDGPSDGLKNMVVIGGLVAVAGGVMLGASIAELVGLGRRSRGAARQAELSSLYLVPTEDGFTAGLAGTF